MKNVLMVAEKPSLAASLAAILSNGRCTAKRGNLNADGFQPNGSRLFLI